MKKLFKFKYFALAIFLGLLACHETIPEEDDIKQSQESEVMDSPNLIDSLKFGENIKPLAGFLTNLVSENFETGGRNYYCYQLKLEKFYPGAVAYPGGGAGFFDLSYSINFKFFTEQKNGPIDEVLTVEMLANIVPYYKAMDQSYAVDKIAVAFLYGDRSFDPNLVGKEYIDYLNSQIRIKTGTLQIKKSGELYLVKFEGETETGEKVSCNFNDKMSIGVDNQLESKENDFTVTEMPGNYIEKDGKYYKLDDGYYYIFSPSTYNGFAIQTVQVIARRDYYWYEYNYGNNFNDELSALINQHWKSNAVFLQFQFGGLNQFQANTYQVAPSDGIHSMGYGLGALRNIPFTGFPNDSLLIGYYHIATDTPFTFTYDEDSNYMKNQIALKSGKLEVTHNSSEYFISGDFVDASGKQVKVKFKANQYPWQFEW
ncbi:MAG TPA: hypothetical protein VLQ91_12960 [Draconibacterium sp.]|nr:hypothetical protein [Draconibacterium sp.]